MYGVVPGGLGVIADNSGYPKESGWRRETWLEIIFTQLVSFAADFFSSLPVALLERDMGARSGGSQGGGANATAGLPREADARMQRHGPKCRVAQHSRWQRAERRRGQKGARQIWWLSMRSVLCVGQDRRRACRRLYDDFRGDSSFLHMHFGFRVSFGLMAAVGMEAYVSCRRWAGIDALCLCMLHISCEVFC